MTSARQSFLGCPVDAVSHEEILARARTALLQHGRLIIEGLNVAKLVVARRDPALMEALTAADVVHVDGAGIAFGARLLGQPLPRRRAGIDVMDDLLRLCAAEGKRAFLLGATAEIVAQTAQRMQAQHPGLMIAGCHHGYFAEAEAAAIARQTAASGAALLLVGMSSPKKEMFLQRYMQACGVQVAMGVGGAFDVVAGVVVRAPLWMQRVGFEWVFRLLQEPRRLAGRYVKTNSIFAWLLLQQMATKCCGIIRHRAVLPWPKFLDRLQQIHGFEAAICRHEIYFLHYKRWMRVRAVAAMARDIALLYVAPFFASVPAVDAACYAVVTLDGASGYETVKRAMAALPSHITCAVVTHPRVKSAALCPARPVGRALVDALRKAMQRLLLPRGELSRVVVASCVLRSVVWQASWQRFYTQHPAMRWCVLHNDFDMMSSAAVAALSPYVTTICVQHGIPTDEFFPTRAAMQIVWGGSSQDVYMQYGTTSITMDALGRGVAAAATTEAPQKLQVISQTHTPVYGIDLKPRFEELAEVLASQMGQGMLQILLHPGEVGNGGVYRHIDASLIAPPPHDILRVASPLCLVVGFISTALLEAACAGHYVVGMDWLATASMGAQQVGAPPVRVHDAAGALALWGRLRESAEARTQHMAAQRAWLTRTFTASGAFRAMFDKSAMR